MHAAVLDGVLGVVAHPQIFEMLFSSQRRCRAAWLGAGTRALRLRMMRLRLIAPPRIYAVLRLLHAKTPFAPVFMRVSAARQVPATPPFWGRFDPANCLPSTPPGSSYTTHKRSVWPRPPRCTIRYSISSSRSRWMLTCVVPQPVCSRTSRRLKRKSVRPRPFHHLVDQFQQPARLRRQFVERTAHQFFHQPVGRGDVFPRGFDVGNAAAPFSPAADADAAARSRGSASDTSCDRAACA